VITRGEQKIGRERAAAQLEKAGVPVTPAEIANIEVADFGLGDPDRNGAAIVTLAETGRIVVKAIVLLPGQVLPEHKHPPAGDDPGKEEVLRVQWGTLVLTAEGRETVMSRGDGCVLAPGTLHSFRGAGEGAVVYSITTTARDALDIFTNPKVVRQTRIRDRL